MKSREQFLDEKADRVENRMVLNRHEVSHGRDRKDHQNGPRRRQRSHSSARIPDRIVTAHRVQVTPVDVPLPMPSMRYIAGPRATRQH